MKAEALLCLQHTIVTNERNHAKQKHEDEELDQETPILAEAQARTLFHVVDYPDDDEWGRRRLLYGPGEVSNGLRLFN